MTNVSHRNRVSRVDLWIDLFAGADLRHLREPNRRHRLLLRVAVRVVVAIVLAATMVEAYVLYEQREGGVPHPVPDPKSKRFPLDAIAFSLNHRWGCLWNAAFENMMAERKKERIKYWCEKREVQIAPP